MYLAAVDLGASSGRVMLANIGTDRLTLQEVHRFANEPRFRNGHLRWDIHALHTAVLVGLHAASTAVPDLAGIGIDSWAVDYGLLNGSGDLLDDPVHYRDRRTDGMLERIHRDVSAPQLYALTGIQELPFNTLLQLAAEPPETLAVAQTMLLITDLLNYWLTGTIGAERTNASTTQFLEVRTGQWATSMLNQLNLPTRILPPLREPGTVIGPLLPQTRDLLGPQANPQLLAVGSHDTASAVVGVPITGPGAAYISSGTWSLVGLELSQPVLTEQSRNANFTNEIGVDGTVRYLRNVMGLWLLQESLRTWKSQGHPHGLGALLAAAEHIPPLQRVINPDHPDLLPPGNMPERIAALCRASGQAEPATQAETVRTILDSLALAYRRTVRAAAELAGRDVHIVHVVGGGARNELLCQLTADACGVPVLAGPVEAAALGNAVVQARALGELSGSLTDLRELIRASHKVVRYDPRGDENQWATAEGALGGPLLGPVKR